MKNNYIILILFFHFFGCSIIDKEYNIDDLYEKDGFFTKEKYTDEGVSGRLYRLYGDDKIYLGYLNNGKKDGSYTDWWENGNKMEEGEYESGTTIGKYFSWYENGNVEWEQFFNKNGEPKGIHKGFRENGTIQSEWNYIKGMNYGYYPNGKIMVEGSIDGNGVTTWYWENGNKQMEYSKTNDIKNFHVSYRYDGSKDFYTSYKDDGTEDYTVCYDLYNNIIPCS